MKGDKLTVENAALSKREDYICIDPEEGRLAHRYFSSVLSDEVARRFEAHLLMCFYCQEVILDLDRIFEIAREHRDEIFRLDEQIAKKSKSMRVSGGSSDQHS